MTKRAEDGYDKLLPTRIRAMMDKQKMKQKDLAEKTGISRQRIGYYADGTNIPDAETLAKIAKALDVSADYLLGLSDNEKPQDESFKIETCGDFIEIMDELLLVTKQSSYHVYSAKENDTPPVYDPETGEEIIIPDYVDFQFREPEIVKYYKERRRMTEFFQNAPDEIKKTAFDYQIRIRRDLVNEARKTILPFADLPF